MGSCDISLRETRGRCAKEDIIDRLWKEERFHDCRVSGLLEPRPGADRFQQQLRPGVGVSRRVFTSSLKRCGSSESNPPCAGSSPYSSHRSHSPSGGVRSQGRPVRAAMKWPGGDTSGGITIRPGMGARVLTRLKRWGCGLCGPTSLCGVGDYPQRTGRVLGGVTWRKR
jgi:hypothetical protein